MRFFRGLRNGAGGPAFQHKAEVIDLGLYPFQLLFIRLAVEQGERLAVCSTFNTGKRGLLFILQLIRYLQPLAQQHQLLRRRSPIFQLFQPVLYRRQRTGLLAVFL